MQYTDLAEIRALSLDAMNKKTRQAVVLGMLALVQDNSGSKYVYDYRLDWSTPYAGRPSVLSLISLTVLYSAGSRSCALAQTLSHMPTATVAGHPTMPCRDQIN